MYVTHHQKMLFSDKCTVSILKPCTVASRQLQASSTVSAP